MIIAHRLSTIIDSDRVLVMDKGYGREYDHPFKLLAANDSDDEISKKTEDGTEDGFFARMVKATGDDPAKQMFSIAKGKYSNTANINVDRLLHPSTD